MSSTDQTQWNISADIYDISESVENLKKRYIPDVNETTLSLGIFGFISDIESKKIQTATIMAGELGNEMFASKAKLDKNIITHAMYSNISDINAKPASMKITLAIRQTDFEQYMNNDTFIFDHLCPLFIGNYEFHLDYDIILKRRKVKTVKENIKYFYNAEYDMDTLNPISSISNRYLSQPYVASMDNTDYIFISTEIHQVAIETTQDKIITGSIIDNKSFVFSFENQLTDFTVQIVSNGKITNLKPLLYGSAIDLDTVLYCWYLYLNDNTVRISFDRNVFTPSLNSDIIIKAQTTLGSDGNFSYQTDELNPGIYFDIESSKYNYRKIMCYAIPVTDSIGGQNKKSVEDLKKIIPKMALSRGYITTETDLNNYFNLISDADTRLHLQKKIDNQLNRIWYCYMLMKDDSNNIIPTNSVPIRAKIDSEYCVECGEGRYCIPAGTLFKYEKDKGYAVPVESIPEPFTDEYFASDTYYYTTIYNIVININPLYCAYYLTLADKSSYFQCNNTNDDMFMGFVVGVNKFKRVLLDQDIKNKYFFSFKALQSVSEDLGLYDDKHTPPVDNTKVIMVIKKDGEAYRYAIANTKSVDTSSWTFEWEFELETNNVFDSNNNICLTNLHEIGGDGVVPGYFSYNSEATIYILGKFDKEYGVNGGRGSLDSYVPDLTGYSLINEYEVVNGLDLLNNFTNMMTTKIVPLEDTQTEMEFDYEITNVPFVGCHYLNMESHVSYFVNELLERKAYIDNCLLVLENNMTIDFKYYNTYGYSYTYTIGDIEQTSLGNIDITMNFRAKLTSSNDNSIKMELINYIKSYIENLNETGEDLHIPNLIHDITEEYRDSLVYIEFMNFNDNRLGINHIELKELDSNHVVPEFINVRNRWNSDSSNLEPCINIEIVV